MLYTPNTLYKMIPAYIVSFDSADDITGMSWIKNAGVLLHYELKKLFCVKMPKKFLVLMESHFSPCEILTSLLIDLYSFSNELISQHNVSGFRGPLHIYDSQLQYIYNPNEISWGLIFKKAVCASGALDSSLCAVTNASHQLPLW